VGRGLKSSHAFTVGGAWRVSIVPIVIAAGATGLAYSEEGKLFRFTLRHSIFMAAVIGMIVMFYSYVMPGWVR